MLLGVNNININNIKLKENQLLKYKSHSQNNLIPPSANANAKNKENKNKTPTKAAENDKESCDQSFNR